MLTPQGSKLSEAKHYLLSLPLTGEKKDPFSSTEITPVCIYYGKIIPILTPSAF